MNYIEHVRRDIEGSDINTRRRIVCELLKGLALNYKDQLTELVSGQILCCQPSRELEGGLCDLPGGVTLDKAGVESFFMSVLDRSGRGADVNAFPMLKAGALKFLTMFLEVKGRVPAPTTANMVAVQSRYKAPDIDPCLPQLSLNHHLFEALKFPLKFPESQENPYVMRLIGVANIGGGIARYCISGLVSNLAEACKNPRSPTFNRYISV